jgi:hypothetical protein
MGERNEAFSKKEGAVLGKTENKFSRVKVASGAADLEAGVQAVEETRRWRARLESIVVRGGGRIATSGRRRHKTS